MSCGEAELVSEDGAFSVEVSDMLGDRGNGERVVLQGGGDVRDGAKNGGSGGNLSIS